MKTSQKVTRVQLVINEPEDPLMFGIVTADPDYKLSLKLNKAFHISLRSVSPVEINDEEGKEMVFSKFSDISQSPDIIFNLFSNRSGKDFMIKKLKNIDYILQLQDSVKFFNADQVATRLRNIDTITAVFNIEFRNLKDKNQKYLI